MRALTRLRRHLGAMRDASRGALGWRALPGAAQLYVSVAIAAGVALVATQFPLALARPGMFAVLLTASCLTSAWKVSLPLGPNSSSTLSVSYAANLMALLLLGPGEAMIVAVAGAWTQCTINVRQPYPLYRSVFSMAAEAVTMQATALAYFWSGGVPQPHAFAAMAKPVVAAIATYFVVNTGLVAGAVGLSSRRSVWRVWRDDFLWSGASVMVAGGAGATAAIVVQRGDHWLAVLMLAPVYLTYRTYEVFLGRIADEKRHAAETRRLHGEAVEALAQARIAEQQLASEKERLAVTLRSIGDGVITTDLNGTIILMNSAAETLTGWTHEEAAGKPLGQVFQNLEPESRRRCESCVEALTRQAERRNVTRASILVARDLSERPIEEIAAPLRDAVGQAVGMVVAFRDITEALQVQEERIRAGRAASLGLLAGGIAHDFNNILTAIMGNVTLARATVSPLGPSAAALAEAEQACLRARQLTWHLLTFSKGGVPVKKPLSVARALEEAAALALRGSNVSCTCRSAPDLWAVSADGSQLEQVFNNILVNARQAMPGGGSIEIRAENVVERTTRWEYTLQVEPGPYVRVSITDSGIGIPEEHLGRIFDPYFSTKEAGGGLGLATSYSIVKNHGGYMSVDSRPGRGTTIQVNLPAAFASGSAEPIAITPGSGRRGRVLVMDDEAAVRLLTLNMLRHLGIDAEVVSNGSAAVERYRRALCKGEPFSAVILDIMVPGGIGAREALERLTELDPAVNAIAISGRPQDDLMTAFRDFGFKAAIGKPFSIDELRKALDTVIPTDMERTWTVH